MAPQTSMMKRSVYPTNFPFTVAEFEIPGRQLTHRNIQKKSGKSQKQTKKFIINASGPANDKIFDVSAFEKFLQEKIKVEGRTGNLGDNIKISSTGDGKVEIISHNELSGRYLKYLTKKFLKKYQLRDWLRVVSTSKGTYELRFYNVVNDEAEDDDE
ncbi:ribosomal protein L22e [Zalerion maritima]|uniref:Ribosomal protein L22e n=1 Tax=Zalerion maritima TaxID=339359 RepID=A0AAD5RVU0_9PEZI|nr:ribosomal protein L22e [Zalerion maritima]